MARRKTSKAAFIADMLRVQGRPDMLWMKQLDHLAERQQAELTDTMLRFDNATHVLRIVEEKGDYLTVTVRERAPQAETLTFRFAKWHKCLRGKPRAVYTFWRADRLLDLAVEPSERVDTVSTNTVSAVAA